MGDGQGKERGEGWASVRGVICVSGRCGQPLRGCMRKAPCHVKLLDKTMINRIFNIHSNL